MKQVDHYAVLGVSPSATPEEIRKTYRTLSMKLHPDRGGDPQRFAEVTESYSVLSDAVARDSYDVEQRLARARAANDERRAADARTTNEQWAASTFTSEAPPRPDPRAAHPSATTSPTTAAPAPHGRRSSPASRSSRLAGFAARHHRVVSYVVAAAVGALWWPVQYLLSVVVPAGPHSEIRAVQRVVTHPGAPVLVVLIAIAAVYLEQRFALVHAVRVAPRYRYAVTAVSLAAFWLNVYLTSPPVLVALVVLMGVALYVTWRRR